MWLNMEIFKFYFPELDKTKIEKLNDYSKLLQHLNTQINLISRKDISNVNEHHILHSLAIAKITAFKLGNEILDIGTGGGLPGIPLAILFPNAHFTLIDSIGKKIQAVESMVAELNLKNVTVHQIRAEEINKKFDYILGKAVASFAKFIEWTKYNIKADSDNKLQNGILYFKGTNYREELEALNISPIKIYKVDKLFSQSHFTDKFIIHIGINELGQSV